MMNEIEKLWEFDSIKNCSVTGYIECAKCELESVFGTPTNEQIDDWTDDPKVTSEWWLRINETVLTIYDYKENRPPADDDKIMWHVGSNQGIQALFELMAVGFEPSQVLTREEFYNKRFGSFA